MEADAGPDVGAGVTAGGSVEIPDRALQSALEFAIDIAAAGTKARPSLPSPNGLRPFLRMQRVPATALSSVRRAVDDDEVFRGRLGSVATPELVDEIGLLWLRRPPGWQASIAQLLPSGPRDGEIATRRDQRRRDAAEQATARARDEADAARTELQGERRSRQQATARVDALAAELVAERALVQEGQATIRRLRRDVDRGLARITRLEEQASALSAAVAEAERSRDAALAARAADPLVSTKRPVDTTAVLGAVELAIAGLDEVRRAVTGASSAARRGKAALRRPIAVPGGLFNDTEAAAEHLLRVRGAIVLVDGYNVAKLGWPALDLPRQREAAIDAAERLARRFGAALTVVFDGADVVGSSTSARRLVRVTYSPAGVSADDVLRAEVAAIDATIPVVVVTNDQEIVADIRTRGANPVSSDQFIALARR